MCLVLCPVHGFLTGFFLASVRRAKEQQQNTVQPPASAASPLRLAQRRYYWFFGSIFACELVFFSSSLFQVLLLSIIFLSEWVILFSEGGREKQIRSSLLIESSEFSVALLASVPPLVVGNSRNVIYPLTRRHGNEDRCLQFPHTPTVTPTTPCIASGCICLVQDTPFASAPYYYENNFNSYPEGLVTLFEMLIVNNWWASRVTVHLVLPLFYLALRCVVLWVVGACLRFWQFFFCQTTEN